MATTLDGTGRLLGIRVSGKGFSSDMAEAAEAVKMSISRTAVTEMSFDFTDSHEGTVFRSGKLAQGSTVTYGAFRMVVEDVDYKPGPIGPTLSIKAPSAYVTQLRSPAHTGGYSWGDRDIREWVVAIAAGVGMGAIVQPGLGRQTILRKAPEGDSEPETTWDVLVALSKATGCWLFEYGAILVFGRPSWLVSGTWNNRVWDIRYDSWENYSEGLEGMPTYSNHPSASDSREGLSFGLISSDADAARPGDILDVRGIALGPAQGQWIIESVDFPLTTAAAVKIKAVRAVDPKIEPPRAEPSSSATGATGSSGGPGGSAGAPNDGGAIDQWAARVLGKRIGTGQCVALVVNYNLTCVGGPMIYGNGRDWYAAGGASGAYTQIPPGQPARKGDIACWGPSWGGGWGHVAVVMADNGGSLSTISQNPDPAARMNLGKNGLMGYLRPKAF